MLDVHPPHSPAHTWKDFFIHIATIVVGLLIAVSLEQTVEYFHHRHQREELIAAFRGECESNIKLADLNIPQIRSNRLWEQRWLDVLRKSALDPHVATITLPARPATNLGSSIGHSVWTIAKSNGTAALIPETLAEVYDRTDHEIDEFYISGDNYGTALRRLGNLARADGFAFNSRVPGPAISVELSPQQRSELIAALSDLIGHDNDLIHWNAILRAASQAVVDNVGSRAAMRPYFNRAQAEDAVE